MKKYIREQILEDGTKRKVLYISLYSLCLVLEYRGTYEEWLIEAGQLFDKSRKNGFLLDPIDGVILPVEHAQRVARHHFGDKGDYAETTKDNFLYQELLDLYGEQRKLDLEPLAPTSEVEKPKETFLADSKEVQDLVDDMATATIEGERVVIPQLKELFYSRVEKLHKERSEPHAFFDFGFMDALFMRSELRKLARVSCCFGPMLGKTLEIAKQYACSEDVDQEDPNIRVTNVTDHARLKKYGERISALFKE